MNTIAERVGVSASSCKLRRDQLSGLGNFLAPETDLEKQVAAAWCAVTGFDRVGVTDDFFALGGTSVQAAQIFTCLEAELGISLPLSTLYRASTVRELAGEFARKQPRAIGRVTAIKTTGKKSPLFIVPGVGGSVVGLAYLANALDADRPVYGFESRGLNPGEEPLDSMERIAAEFIADMKRVQPAGPYRLLGICWGGVAALEVARQLNDAGEQVASLLMLDPPFPGAANSSKAPAISGEPAVASFIGSRIKLYWNTLRELPPKERAAYLRERFAVLADILRHRDLFRGDDSELRRRKVLAANRHAVRTYTAPALGCDSRLIFTADRVDGPSKAARERWIGLLNSAAEPVYVPGADTGNAISPEFADHVADAIRPSLD